MKRKYILSLILVCLLGAASAQTSYVVGSFNLRYANPGDSGNLWSQRAPMVSALIRFHRFDILGTQEGLPGMLDDISRALPEYQCYGIGRDDGKDAGEHSAIFFRKDQFTMLDHGDFWLSETPDKPSLGWDATCCNRICSWVLLQDRKTHKKLYVFNTHYDYQKDLARNESSKLILQKIKAIAGQAPVLFMGDLNGGYDSPWYKAIAGSGILSDTHDKAPHPYDANTSFHGFGRLLRGNDAIDHVFASAQFSVLRWGILTDSFHGKYPSDHFPILTELVLH